MAGASLRSILESALAPFQDDMARRFSLDGPDLALPDRYVLALGMTIHELITNAVRYGSLATETGRIDIAWTLTEDGQDRRHRLV